MALEDRECPDVSAPSTPTAFAHIAVGGRPIPRPKTGITELDVEVTILQRCLDRLTSKRLQRDALPPPNTVHAALGPVVTPILPPVEEIRELSTEDPEARFSPNGRCWGKAEVSRRKAALRSADSCTGPYRESIQLEELEVEVGIMQNSLDNLVLRIAQLHLEPQLHAKSASQILTAVPASSTPRLSTGGSFRMPPLSPSTRASSLVHLPLGAQPMEMVEPSVPADAEADEYFSPQISARSGASASLPPNATPSVDNTFWGHISRFCVYGLGTYQFNVGTVGNRLKLAKEAANYGLATVSEELFSHPKCTICSCEFRYPLRALERSEGSRQTLLKDPSTLQSGNPIEFFAIRDCPGIVYFIGTAYGSKPWRNPSQLLEHRLIDVKISSSAGSGKAADVVTAHAGYFITQDRPNSWIQIDFCNQLVIPKCYSFASAHPMYAGYYPRNWEFQGSMDGKSWTCLKRHINDTTINKFNPVGYWLLDNCRGMEKVANKTFYRFFRIIQTGLNSFDTHELQCSSFEVYGQLIYLAKQMPLPAPPPAWDAEHDRSPSPVPDSPDPPKVTTAKPKGKRK